MKSLSFRGLCNFFLANYVDYCTNIRKLQSQEMNTWTLLIVFLSGALFAVIISILRTTFLTAVEEEPNIGVFPAEVDLDLMDDGYVAMALLGDHGLPQRNINAKKQTTELEERNFSTEALNSLKAAKELVKKGKNVRAGRLLEHAYSLMPRHSDVLIQYGEYLEHQNNDIVRADHLYLRALSFSPANSIALRNRQRTQPIIDELDSVLLARIDAKQDEFSMIPSTSASLRRIKKEAYFHYIYHTAAIEGSTLTLAQTRMILETRLSVGGKSVIEHNEVLGLDLALRYINTTLIHRVGQITLHDILEIHRRVLGHADPLEAGLFRTTQVYVSDHVPPAPTRLQMLMEGFVHWLNSEDAGKIHPIKYAALAHYKMVYIHPFVDGNGRTARLLMNFLLMQAGYPPVIIRKQDRMMYYDYLQTANDGDTRPFVRFIAHCTEKTIDVYLWATREYFPEIEQDPKYEMPVEPPKSVFQNQKTKNDLPVISSFNSIKQDSYIPNLVTPQQKPKTFFSNCDKDLDSSCMDSDVITDTIQSSSYSSDDHTISMDGSLWLSEHDQDMELEYNSEQFMQRIFHGNPNDKIASDGPRIKKQIFQFDDDSISRGR